MFPRLASLKASRWVRAGAAALALCSVPAFADPPSLGVSVETGAGIPLGGSTDKNFGVGFTQSIKGQFGMTEWFFLQPTIGFMMLPPQSGFTGLANRSTVNEVTNEEQPSGEPSGTAFMLGHGFRFQRPLSNIEGFGVAPWVDTGLYYVRSGELNRPGFDVGTGLLMPIGDSHTFWMGPFVRYSQVLMLGARDGWDGYDPKVLTMGVSIQADAGLYKRRGSSVDHHPVTPSEVVTPPAPPAAPVTPDSAPPPVSRDYDDSRVTPSIPDDND